MNTHSKTVTFLMLLAAFCLLAGTFMNWYADAAALEYLADHAYFAEEGDGQHNPYSEMIESTSKDADRLYLVSERTLARVRIEISHFGLASSLIFSVLGLVALVVTWMIAVYYIDTYNDKAANMKKLIEDTRTELSKFAGVFLAHNTLSRTKPLGVLINSLDRAFEEKLTVPRMLEVTDNALCLLKDECHGQETIITIMRWNLLIDIERLERLGVQTKNVKQRLPPLTYKTKVITLKDNLHEQVRILWDRLFELAVAGYFTPEEIEGLRKAGIWTYVHDDSLRHYLKPNGRFHDLLGDRELALWHKYLIEAKNPRPKKDQAEEKA